MIKYFAVFYSIAIFFSGLISTINGIFHLLGKFKAPQDKASCFLGYITLLRGLLTIIIGVIMTKLFVSGVVDEWVILVIGSVVFIPGFFALKYFEKRHGFRNFKSH